MAQYDCYGSFKVCAIRAARLGANCAPLAGPNNGFASSGIISINATAEKQTGTEYQLDNGCGDITHYARDKDRTKMLNLTLEMTSFDFEAIELLTGGDLIMDNATPTPKVVGISDPGLNGDPGYGAYLEIWTRTIIGSDVCGGGEDEGFQWFRTIFPRVLLSKDDTNYANEIATVTLSGYGFANPAIPANGPFGDYPISGTLDPEAPRHMFGDPTGIPQVGCGYISVPGGSGS